MMEMVKAQQRTVRQSNAYTDGISPFSHPEGERTHPKAKLDRESWFCASRLDEAQMTPQEIELCNQITTSKTWRGDPKFGAEVSPKRRFIMLPHVSIDERMALPASLSVVLMELIGGQDAVKPEQMADELLAMKAQLKAMKAEMEGVMGREPAELLAMATHALPSSAEFGM
jgi:hypothetical protein